MAEQVVDIRERIEKMRTQIYDKPQLDNSSVDKGKEDDSNVKSKHNSIGKKFDKSEIKQKDKNLVSSAESKLVKETNDKTQIKSNMPMDNVEKKDFKSVVEKMPLRDNDFEKKELKKNQKSYENYQLDNTVSKNNKEFNLRDQKQPFPQFSLNVNNPISWKLMLLIMLMQLLTNIMLVVVLYLK
ncbi:MAG: hypothetical protein CMM91_05050 [Rickettsiales bacterium]|nr:hypothetical protein [Rickettsiales bacterium]OUV53830.1 MAG: hypothetical protein CBC87_03790 [Rickettsiales bacterium TMED127]|tara:strand:- start:1387 stop:1938 length:552 start_codon:yes stop_codon:yes gene_type:complete